MIKAKKMKLKILHSYLSSKYCEKGEAAVSQWERENSHQRFCLRGTGYFIMARIFNAMIGAQHAASVNTIRKNLRANSESPTDNGVARRVLQMLANMAT